MENSFVPKFSIGEFVFVIDEKESYKKTSCKLCEGKGNLIVKDTSIRCPKCIDGKITKTSFKFYPVETLITSVFFKYNPRDNLYGDYDELILEEYTCQYYGDSKVYSNDIEKSKLQPDTTSCYSDDEYYCSERVRDSFSTLFELFKTEAEAIEKCKELKKNNV